MTTREIHDGEFGHGSDRADGERGAADGVEPGIVDDGEQLEVDERRALRRVDGLSTELRDISEVEYRTLRLEYVVLIGVWTSGTAAEADNSLTELKLLAETAGCEVLEGLVQRRDTPDPATYIGSGKARQLRDHRGVHRAPTP